MCVWALGIGMCTRSADNPAGLGGTPHAQYGALCGLQQKAVRSLAGKGRAANNRVNELGQFFQFIPVHSSSSSILHVLAATGGSAALTMQRWRCPTRGTWGAGRPGTGAVALHSSSTLSIVAVTGSCTHHAALALSHSGHMGGRASLGRAS